MISVGVDVSKGKSTVCIMKPYGEIVLKPFEVQHTENELCSLEKVICNLDGEARLVMEATGIYHLPFMTFFLERGYYARVSEVYK